MVKTDLTFVLPDNCYARLAPRSDFALQHFKDVGAAVVDRDYTGSIFVVLFSRSDVDIVVSHGDRIYQLICEVMYYPKLCEITYCDNTTIGSSGFGSSGLQLTS